MREYLFIGKRLDNGEWIEGNLVTKNDPVLEVSYCFILAQGRGDSFVTWHMVDPETVGQYAGLMDKTGKRIFEGNVVIYDNSPYNAYCEPIRGVIAWRNGSLCFKYQLWNSVMYRALCSDDFFAAKCEVIGNVHDNPELLKEGQYGPL